MALTSYYAKLVTEPHLGADEAIYQKVAEKFKTIRVRYFDCVIDIDLIKGTLEIIEPGV